MVKQRKEAVEEWRRHFVRVLNKGGSSEVLGGREMSVDESELFDEEITREEVEQKASPGSDGLTAVMVSSKELVDLWLCLFNWCWTYGMEKKCSCTYTKEGGGVCKRDVFQGISLVSVPYKAV